MIYYENIDQLSTSLYREYFIDYLRKKGVIGEINSGVYVLSVLRQKLEESAGNNVIPSQLTLIDVNQNLISKSQFEKLEEIPFNLIKLADEMINDLKKNNTYDYNINSNILHEWSYANVINSLCPLFPFC